MSTDIRQKTLQYEGMLADALQATSIAVPPETPLYTAATECHEMADAYLNDGRHFLANDDLVNALAAFSYGHGWLDAAVRFGIFSIPDDTELFTM